MNTKKLSRIEKLELIRTGLKYTSKILKEKEEAKWANYNAIYGNKEICTK